MRQDQLRVAREARREVGGQPNGLIKGVGVVSDVVLKVFAPFVQIIQNIKQNVKRF